MIAELHLVVYLLIVGWVQARKPLDMDDVDVRNP